MIRWIPLYDDAIIPTRATKRSAGYDLYAQHGSVIEPGKWGLVKIGVTIEINELLNVELQVRPRSGLALKNGITVLNAPGTVDGDFSPNEIGVVLMNHSENPFFVHQGDRIAQGVIAEYFTVQDTVETERTGGFGSTGVINKSKMYEIWMEGYRATGESSPARFVGKSHGETFKQACDNFYKDNKIYNEKQGKYWGCKLYDNEEDARKTFG